jgi:diguanylate cyclase (GGDEF)-like protein
VTSSPQPAATLTGYAAPYLAAVLAAIDAGVILSDASGRIIHVGAALCELLGPVPHAAAGLHRGEVLRACADHVEEPAAFLQAAGVDALRLDGPTSATGFLSADLEVRRPAARTVRWTSSRITLPDGDGRLDMFRDVTLEIERVRLQAQLGRIDPLTGLLGRRGADEALVREQKRAQRTESPLAVVLVDLDRLEILNDLRGHAAGDRAIQEVARAVVSIGRSTDVVARWGGATLLALLPGSDIAGGAAWADRARRLVSDLHIDGHGLAISAGVAELRASDGAMAAVERAAHALRAAKAAGRNTVR